MDLFYLLKQNICVELNIIQLLKQFPSEMGEAGAAS